MSMTIKQLQLLSIEELAARHTILAHQGAYKSSNMNIKLYDEARNIYDIMLQRAGAKTTHLKLEQSNETHDILVPTDPE